VFSLKKLCKSTHFKPRLIEHQTEGKLNGLSYGMQCDAEGILFDTEAILDFKIGQPHKAHGVQLAGYAVGLPHPELTTAMAKFMRRKRYGVYLRPDGEIAKLVPYTEKRDLDTFASCLEVLSRKMDWKIKVRRLDED
jgi:hypothetical protein